jgi:protein-S-isoprenylcysteine O-methyltransferase Ste14
MEPEPDAFVRVGHWLFRHRTSIPVPVALALALLPATSASPTLFWSGAALVAAGEWLRLTAVRRIGAISRTRSDRLGPLVASGPFQWVRNPLYIGNIAIWLGFTLAAGLPWLAAPIAILLGLEYHAIVRWEEHLLQTRRGDAYRAYSARVPRWLPRLSTLRRPPAASDPRPAFGWRETLFSERGTLIGVAAGALLLSIKNAL